MEPVPTEAGPTPAGPKPVDDPRVYLAAERTFLAWVRTSVALMGFGFLIARFAFWLRQSDLMQGIPAPTTSRVHVSPWLGFGMVVVGVYVVIRAAIRHQEYIRALRSGVANPSLSLRTPMTIAAILALVGLAMAIQILLF